MKIIVAAGHASVAGVIRGALQMAKVQNAVVCAVTGPDQIAKEIGEETVVLVDWDENPAIAATFIAVARKAARATPILFLCSKAKAGTIPEAIKVGTGGILYKPVDANEISQAIAAALQPSLAKRPAVNVEFINPFIEAAKNVFVTMCKLPIERKDLFLKADHKMYGDISGVMGLSGEATGSVVISLPTRLACEMIGRMLGEPPLAALDDCVCDGVAELINVIAG